MGSIVLLGCLLAPAQPPVPATPASRLRSPEWSLVPHLERGQELLYRGSFREQSAAVRVRFERVYRVESRMLVLDSLSASHELAVLTTVRDRAAGKKEAGSVRLEKLKLSLLGRATGASLLVPVD